MVAAFYVPGDVRQVGRPARSSPLAAVTDYFDGYLARSWSMQSPLGRMLDPIADKLLVGAAILMLVHFDRAPILPALVILCREILVSGLREFLAEVQVGLPVSRLAKWKTGVQMVAIGFLLGGHGRALVAVRRSGRVLRPVARRRPDPDDGLRLSGGRPAPFQRAGAGRASARARGRGCRSARPRAARGDLEDPLFRLAARQDRHGERGGVAAAPR